MKNVFEEIMNGNEAEAEREDEKSNITEELSDSTTAAKMAKCEIAEVAIKLLRTLPNDDRIDVCCGMLSIFSKVGMFAGLGIEEVFQDNLDALEEAMSITRKEAMG